MNNNKNINETDVSKTSTGERILLVDDDDTGREILTAQLEEAGYCVSSARNGQEAFDWVQILPPDLIISDVLMPKLDGFSLCRRLREREESRQVPVIFYTGEFLTPEDQNLAFSLGVIHYLVKPLDSEKLLSIIKSTLSEDHSISDVTRMTWSLQKQIPEQHLDRLTHHLYDRSRQLSLSRKQLLNAELCYRQLLETTPDGLIIADAKGIIRYMNPQVELITGYTSEELVGQVVEVLLPDDKIALHLKYREWFNNSSSRFRKKRGLQRFQLKNKQGLLIPIIIDLFKMKRDQKEEVTIIIRDIQERVKAEQDIFTLSKLYRTLIQCNQALIRADHEEEVVSNFCRTLVEEGGFSLAWVGYRCKNDELEVVAWTAVENIIVDSKMLFNCEVGNFKSGMALPLLDRTSMSSVKPIGVLTIYRTEMMEFSENEVTLLDELAKDLSYGIVTQRSELKRKQVESELFLHQRALDASINGVILTDAIHPEHPIVYANPAFLKTTGYAREEVLGKNPRFLFGGELEQEGVEELRLCLHHQQPASVMVKNFRKDGSEFWNDTRIAPVRDEHGILTHYVGIANDVSERKGYERALEYQANHDALTGLANRNLMKDRLKQALLVAKRSETRVAVLFVDLDRFKLINDSLGHDAGDELLVELGKRFTSLLREEDSIARWGGDEFVIIMPGLKSKNYVATLIDQILSVIRQPVTINGRALTVSGSIGCSFFPHDSNSPEKLLGQADSAMYRSKELGGDTYQLFSESMNIQIRQRLDIEMSLKKALANKEFELYYQPQVKMSTGEIVGAEALIRWHHPEKGLVPPDDFIPIAEEMGLIRELGLWVLQEAGSQMKQWQACVSSGFKMAINVSYHQFTANDFLQKLHTVIAHLQIPPEQIELELTERVMMKDMDWIRNVLNKIRKTGLHISIDDFGTGYSSLSYLQHLPIDRLKIDRSFVSDLSSNDNSAAITLAIIRMAHALRYDVVAEGVETNDQLKSLLLQGCDLVQGYLFSPPLPFMDFKKLLKQNDFAKIIGKIHGEQSARKLLV